MTKPIHILQICNSTSYNDGVLNVILNWHRRMDRTRVQLDYLVLFSVPPKNSCEKEITSLGGQVYYLNFSWRHPFKFLCNSYHFFKTHRYTTIHSHITHLNLFFFPLAKMFGTKNIIQHSHLTKWSENKLSGLRNYLMLHAVWSLITHKMACSQSAGNAYFGKNFIVANNGIDVKKFRYNPEIRIEKRKELGLENNFVIGHVGRFSIQKNHKFLIDIFEQILKKEPAAKLVVVGDGPLEEYIKSLVKSKNLQNNVLFLGVCKDVAELYQAFDCFVFPSLYEGLGIVAIEAQAAGLPCVLADTLPHEAFICNYKKLPLGNVTLWAREILKFIDNYKRKDANPYIIEAGFSSQDVALKIQNFYIKLEK